ncbi:hypothetical protein PC116_g27102 [Phytophthora cactorum]|uniref:LRRK2 ARM repeat domain-containing protein n=1 Tax=Phytophthora cactorum TaxID=29920 RepID=A0A329SW13_9STRA|nr:hypothetical protein Pcac1_g20096 [Phytophthora cactorum]KAG3055055.1 hypothetical protein PC122_g21818 [Phytophthora cactorum]KAG4224446.1 hypothetical protein PC116_g27102 [Phytophthora cactorum]RAW40641.1 hypothetical protein PC110_g3190 [Phytophthora cactorum]
MLDTTAHMLLLLQQAKIKNERPVDASFLPLSLSMACLLRQLPAGLAPPAGGLSFHQLDRLPQEVLERKLAAMLLDDPLRAFTLVCALVKYTKVTRELLSICHDHMSNRVSTVDATQSVVQAVVEALPPLDADVEGDDDDGDEEVEKQEDKPVERPVQEATVKVDAKMTGPSQLSEKLTTSAVATDPAGIMRRAVGRDVGDGSTVLEIMKKFPTDVRIQSHGVRALKGLIRSVVDSEAKKASAESFPTTVSTHEEEDEEDHTEDRHLEDQKTEKSSRLMVQMVIDTMKQFPESLALQRDGLLCLAEYANQADEHIAIITSSGGIISLIDAMVALPDDIPANMAGLSVLAHPKIADESVVRVNPESRRLVLSAMERFPLNEQVQGLSCLALANLSLRQDASMLEIVSKGGLEIVVESMKRFSSTALVQAAGCWFVAIISGNNEGMKTACLDVGALPVCEKARLRFPDDPKVQQHAVQAIQTMLPGEVIEGDDSSTPETCSLQ